MELDNMIELVSDIYVNLSIMGIMVRGKGVRWIIWVILPKGAGIRVNLLTPGGRFGAIEE